MRHDGIDLDGAHALTDRPLHAQQADAVLVLQKLADRAHPAVAKMIDVIDLATPVLEINERFDDAQDVFLAQRPQVVVGLKAESGVHLHPPDRREIVAFRVKEQAFEQRLRGL